MVLSKLTRLCWNKNGWIKPSGSEGKSKIPDQSECKYGFGYEEWIFDVSKVIGGFHYGWVEGADKSKGRLKYLGMPLNVGFYSINVDTGDRYLIGEVKNLLIVPHEESEMVWYKYEENGWLYEMSDQIQAVRGDVNAFWQLWKDTNGNFMGVIK